MLLFILPDKNENNDEGIGPMGKLKVSPAAPESGRRRIHGGKRFIQIFKKPAVILPLMLIMIISVLAALNSRDNIIPDGDSIDLIDGKPDRILSDGEIPGNWTLIDYVENISGFDADSFSRANHNINLPWMSFEFFDDKTAVLKTRYDEKTGAWLKGGDIFGFLSADIIVHAIENINGADYMFIGSKALDSDTGAETPGYYVLKKARVKSLFSGADIRNRDVRNYDFSELKYIHSLLFNENTRFPGNNMGVAAYVMERGKNPGLGAVFRAKPVFFLLCII